MNRYRMAGLTTLLFSTFAVSAAETSYTILGQPGFSAKATISDCQTGCSKQMAISGSYDFVFDGDYQNLLSELESFGWRVTVYDSAWQDAESGELLFKVSSTIHQRQIWRRANLRRKVDSPATLANAIYTTVTPGSTVTLEFLQDAAALTSSDFTVNVRRYEGEELLGSGSRAVTPEHVQDNAGDTHIQ